ncbi:MAG: gamma-glutamylcyclotransferase [Myxococcales bacterium]|nr:gamma-glutamylcyclotransferase [Myxococcales bacterium]
MTHRASEQVWLFGYGSLMWRPDVEFTARVAAVLPGYQRRFWQRSTDHRGTVAHPGRVVTLVPVAGARTAGIAYRLRDPVPTLARIDHREQQGYQRRELEVHAAATAWPARQRGLRATVYVADPDNPYFSADETPAHSAQIIARAHGPSGANLEYARALVTTLEVLRSELALAEHELAYEREVLAHAEALAR